MESDALSLKRRKQREYKQKYRRTHQEFILCYSFDDAEAIQEAARKKGLAVIPYIKAAVYADISDIGYVTPKESKLLELILEIRRIGTNINQVVRHVNTESNVTYADISQLQASLANLEVQVHGAISRPPSIESIIQEEIAQHPEAKEKLITFLNSLP